MYALSSTFLPRYYLILCRSQRILTLVFNKVMLVFSAPLKGSCWFCLGSPQVEKHLVVSVGDDVSANQLINYPWSTSKSDSYMLSVRRNVTQTVINRSASLIDSQSVSPSVKQLVN